MNFNIVETNYTGIKDIWSSELWRGRNVEPMSCMLYKSGYSIQNLLFTPTYIVALSGSKILGVNSYHCCIDNSYRSRGLFVYPEFRKRGVGVSLLEFAINKAMQNRATFCWSYPKLSACSIYEHAGFVVDYDTSNGDNAFCRTPV